MALHLAVCLVDAIQDENLDFVLNLIRTKKADPTVITSNGFSPLHYIIGFKEETEFTLKTLELFLANSDSADVETPTEKYTPLHVAAMNSMIECTKILIENNANVYAKDAEGNTAIHYATLQECFEIVRLLTGKILHDKREKKRKEQRGTPLKMLQLATATPVASPMNLTPVRINYNFNRDSPYYINITHRKKIIPQNEEIVVSSPIPDSNLNVFDLTEANLARYSQSLRQSGKFQKMEEWRDKIEKYRSRKSYLALVNDIDNHLGRDTFFDLSERYLITDDETEKSFKTAKTGKTYTVSAADKSKDNLPVPDEEFKIKSPLKRSSMTNLVQVLEEYVHIDDEKHIQFKEKKYLPVNADEISDKRSTASTKFDDFRLDTDYDTDILREELIKYGESPGPITKSTKKLYVKRLCQYKRNPSSVKPSAEGRRIYSLELEKTFKNIKDGRNVFLEFLELEKTMIEHFQAAPRKNLREGNRKMSFIYLLLDPRELKNLSAEHSFMQKIEVWQQFLRSIFYIGKGKKSRPYQHLYDAIRCFSNNRPVEDKQNPKESEKLKKIVDIWKDQKGVVCLNIFHSIIPSEAYTREAAMIDAMSLTNLTNLKRGDYYGIVQSWTMRQRKELGVGLLVKALHIHLIEGESQIMPSDLL